MKKMSSGPRDFAIPSPLELFWLGTPLISGGCSAQLLLYAAFLAVEWIKGGLLPVEKGNLRQHFGDTLSTRKMG